MATNPFGVEEQKEAILRDARRSISRLGQPQEPPMLPNPYLTDEERMAQEQANAGASFLGMGPVPYRAPTAPVTPEPAPMQPAEAPMAAQPQMAPQAVPQASPEYGAFLQEQMSGINAVPESGPAQMGPRDFSRGGQGVRTLDAIFSGLAGKGYNADYWEGADLRNADRQDQYLGMQQQNQARAQEQYERQRVMQDPNSPESRAVQQRVKQMYPDAPDEVIAGITAGDTLESKNIATWLQRGAERAAMMQEQQGKLQREDMLNEQKRQHDINLQAQRDAAAMERAKLKRKRGGGGMGMSPELRQQQVQSVDAIAETLVNDYGYNREAIAGLAARAKLPGRVGEQAGKELRGYYTGQVKEGLKTERKEVQEDEQHRVPGWTRRPDAPELSSGELRDLRAGTAAYQKMRGIVRQMQALAKKVTPAELAAAKAGKDSANTALARQLQRSMTTQLRIIANMGVPSLAEMKVVSEQAPELTTIEGFLNAPQRFGAIEQDIGSQLEAEMTAYGYDPAPAAGAKMIKVRNPKTGEVKEFPDSKKLQLRLEMGVLEAVDG